MGGPQPATGQPITYNQQAVPQAPAASTTATSGLSKAQLEARAKKLEDKYKAQTMLEWVRANRPKTAKKLIETQIRIIKASNFQVQDEAEVKKRAEQEVEEMDDRGLGYVLDAQSGSAWASKVITDYNKYKKDNSVNMAREVSNETAAGRVPIEREWNAPDGKAFERESGRIADDEDPAKPTTQAPIASSKASDGAVSFASTDYMTGAADPMAGFSYQGVSEMLSMRADLGQLLTAEQLRSKEFQISVTGGGMTDQLAKARSTTAAVPYDVATRTGSQAGGRPRPTMEQRGLGGYGGGRGATQASGPLGRTGKSRSYAESMAYLNTLDPAQVTRIQQHLAMAGYFTPSELRNKSIMWGYSGDELTAQAWTTLHDESLRDKKDISQVIKDRQIQYAPNMAAFLAGTDETGPGQVGGGSPITITLSDPATIKIAADNAFTKILGRLPDAKESAILVDSIRGAEAAQGQSHLAQLNAVNARNQARVNAAAGVTGAGTALTVEQLAALQPELDVLLGGTPQRGGSIIFPVAGKTSYGNDWGQGRSGGRSHQGTDIFAAEGTGVVAAVAGTVRSVGTGGVQGKMKSISVRGVDGKNYFYNHLSDQVAVTPGQQVHAGQVIGSVGNAVQRIGTGNHLHFSINEGTGRAENPYPYLQGGQRTGETKLPVGPPTAAQTAKANEPLEAAPESLLTLEGVDPSARVEQWAKEHRPEEYGAQQLGNAYATLTDLLRGDIGGL